MITKDQQEYFQQDSDQYAALLLKNAAGHLCFDCRKRIDIGDTVTLSFAGIMPIYHHTACLFPEKEAQEIYEDSVKNNHISTKGSL